MKLLIALLTLAVLAGCQPTSFSTWQLDNEASNIHFISTKATNIAEVHEFKNIQGSLSSSNNLVVDIDLSSVETLIPIRNERMKEFLFQVAKFPQAKISSLIDTKQLNNLSVGESFFVEKKLQLLLSGKKTEFSAKFAVTKLIDNKIQISSTKPIIVNAQSFELVEGIEKLRSLAGLPNISTSVPVMIHLVFYPVI